MRTDRTQVVLRGREGLEAVDLGFRMARAWWRPLLTTWVVLVLPFLFALVLALRHHPWWALFLLWWLRPAFDRVPLFVLGRALFGEPTTLSDAAAAFPSLLRSGLGTSLFVQRLPPARAFLLPVLQLEGLRGAARRARCSALARRDTGAAMALHAATAHFNAVLIVGLLLGAQLLVPREMAWDVLELFLPYVGDAGADPGQALVPALYVVGISLVEPLLVAGGFALYVNRRVYLEGWDIDLAFRRLTRRVETERRASSPVNAAAVAGLALAIFHAAPAHADDACAAGDPATAARCIESVLGNGEFGALEDRWMWLPRDFTGNLPLPALEWLPDLLALGFELTAWSSLAVLVVALLVAAARRMEARNPEPELPAPQAQASLFGLDLDPRSLPEDVVGTARKSWARGAAIEALSLLYRGALLDLSQDGALLIPESATELECVRLVQRRAATETASLFGDLTDAWVRARYAAEPPTREGFEALCGRFQPVFGAGA